MGRPRLHDAGTAVALVDEAERIVETEGLEALTVRRVASGVGTSTRAVYSVFGSKEALAVALGTRAFEMLRDRINAMLLTDDPAADLVEAGVQVFRRFATTHPALYEVAFRAGITDPRIGAGFRIEATEALVGLHRLVARLEPSGGLGSLSIAEATADFHALCEGLANCEPRSSILRDDLETRWRHALTALVRGFATL